MYRTEETQPEVLREFEETDDQLADYRARKRREAQAARDQVASGKEIRARTGLFGNQDTLKRSGTTADGRQILDVTNRGFRLAAPDRSTVIGNRRYDRLTTTDDKGRIRYQYVQAKGQQGQVANPDNAPVKPEPSADAPAPGYRPVRIWPRAAQSGSLSRGAAWWRCRAGPLFAARPARSCTL